MRTIWLSEFEAERYHVVLCGVALGVLYLFWEFRDLRAFGTSRARDDLWRIPNSYPLIGNLFDALKKRERSLEKLTDGENEKPAHARYKHVTLTVPFMRIIRLNRPEHVQHVQKTNFVNYGKGKIFHDSSKQLLGDGIFAVDGHQWLVQRKATSKIFNGKAFRRVITHSLDRNLNLMAQILDRYAHTGETFDLAGLFFLLLSTASPNWLLGVVESRFINPFWKVTEVLTGEARKMREAVAIIDKFTYDLIEERARNGLNGGAAAADGETRSKSGKDLLSLYMSIRDEQGKPLSRTQLRDAVINLIIAGRDTTAQACSWSMFHLMLHPEVVDRIRAEVEEMGSIDYDSYRTMTQTNAAFNEALRLHPSVPKNLYVAFGDDQIPNGGPSIKKGDTVMWVDWATGRDTQLWGPDAREFKPSRWIDECGELKREDQWKYHVYNGGARACLGQDLARYEGAGMLATILRGFDVDFAPGYLDKVAMIENERTPMYKTSLTLPM
ncbi:BZ3500_MvSof-1268-A1-R1_Chr2-2g05070 [Microbotryum saponariae]|uniref:BZ3500_MvSof-1268-A1-R1_Chr2-2g05070 protein n=1 Tax=Microbotryum saponariae TaxID=289078 RepID=A0A2X0M7I6_9BASI|nr:BZ3500_MvSof-1268-A1-R1_Chr2-2g05070 [Microbotryum saponariae]SDA00840.1 BZ3501_MvSof-1269-A2-R1_Chr2-2g04744 [Microbotryum saponariae]